MNNFVQNGNRITVTAPYAVSSGGGCKVGGSFGIAAFDAALSANLEIATAGVYDLVKDASTFTDGAAVYWDDTAKKATSTVSTNMKIGAATLTQPGGAPAALGGATGDATVRVRLNGVF